MLISKTDREVLGHDVKEVVHCVHRYGIAYLQLILEGGHLCTPHGDPPPGQPPKQRRLPECGALRSSYSICKHQECKSLHAHKPSIMLIMHGSCCVQLVWLSSDQASVANMFHPPVTML